METYTYINPNVKAVKFDGTGAHAMKIVLQLKSARAICKDGVWAIIFPAPTGEFSYLVEKGDYVLQHPDGSHESFNGDVFEKIWRLADQANLGYGMTVVINKKPNT